MSVEQLLLIICGFGIVQSLILAGVLLLHPRSEKTVNLQLALFILALSMTMYVPVVQYFTSWQIMIFFTSSRLLIGPLLYLYVRSYQEVITWRKSLPHLVLFMLAIVLITYLHFTKHQAYPPSKDIPKEMVGSWVSRIVGLIQVGSMIAYLYLSGKILKRYQQTIRHLFSETSQIDLRWVRWLLNGFLFIVFCNIIVYILLRLDPGQWEIVVLGNTVFVSIYVCLISIRGISQSTLWQVQPGFTKAAVEDEISKVNEMVSKSRERSPDREKFDQIIQRALVLMEKEKLYRESELTLQDLADRIQTPAYQVSQAINEGMNKNFYDLVNGYRVEEAKRLLLDPRNQNLKVLSCGMDAGFKSKTTFNTVCKKVTGYSPTDFRQAHGIAVSQN